MAKLFRAGRLGSVAILWCFALAGLTACGGPDSGPVVEDPNAKKDLEQFFLRFRQKVQNGQTDSLPGDLSRESIHWVDDIRRAARSEHLDDLKQRSFADILCILALRVEHRMNPAFDDRPGPLMDKLVVQNYYVRKTLIKTDLGEAKVRGDHGEYGLREAPDVPVFYFEREAGQWKFHLFRSLPLILQGAESLARSRRSNHFDEAVYILEQFGNRRVLPEDLDR